MPTFVKSQVQPQSKAKTPAPLQDSEEDSDQPQSNPKKVIKTVPTAVSKNKVKAPVQESQPSQSQEKVVQPKTINTKQAPPKATPGAVTGKPQPVATGKAHTKVNPTTVQDSQPSQSEQQNTKKKTQISTTKVTQNLKSVPQKPQTKGKPADSQEENSSQQVVQVKAKPPAKPLQKVQLQQKKKSVDIEEESQEQVIVPKKQAAVKAAVRKGSTDSVQTGKKAQQVRKGSKDFSESQDKTKKMVQAKKAPKEESESDDQSTPVLKKQVPKSKNAPPPVQAKKPPVVSKTVLKPAEESQSQSEQVKPVKAAKPSAVAVKPTAKPVAKKVEMQQQEQEQQEQPKRKMKGATGAVQMKSQKKGEEEHFEVYVGGLSFKMTQEQIKESFSQCGNILKINCLKYEDGRLRGIAFIQFDSIEGVQNAVAYNGQELAGRVIKVQRSKGPQTQKKKDFKKSNENVTVSADATTCFVGNLNFKTSVEEIGSLFGHIDGYVDARIITDRETGNSRGFGYVEFSSANGVKQALKLNGSALNGRNLNVNVAQTKKEGGSGFGGGNRGGNRGGFGGGNQGGYQRNQGGFGGNDRSGFGGQGRSKAVRL